MSGPEQQLPDDQLLQEFLSGQGAVRAAYTAAQNSQPPPMLDAPILAQAQQAVAAAHVTRRSTLKPRRRWQAPAFASAAVVVLSIGVLLQVQRDPEAAKSISALPGKPFASRASAAAAPSVAAPAPLPEAAVNSPAELPEATPAPAAKKPAPAKQRKDAEISAKREMHADERRADALGKLSDNAAPALAAPAPPPPPEAAMADSARAEMPMAAAAAAPRAKAFGRALTASKPMPMTNEKLQETAPPVLDLSALETSAVRTLAADPACKAQPSATALASRLRSLIFKAGPLTALGDCPARGEVQINNASWAFACSAVGNACQLTAPDGKVWQGQ